MASKEQQQAKEQEVVVQQFTKNLDHILFSEQPEEERVKKGPLVTVGKTKLQFKRKASVAALAALLRDGNKVTAMIQYISKTLEPGQEEAFEALLEDTDLDGLAEIINALGEGYTSFQEKS